MHQETRRPGHRARFYLLAAALVVVVGVLALLAAGLLQGAGLGARADKPQAPLAPDFTLARLDGGEFHLAEQRGKVVVLNFWAPSCPPCRQEMPAIQQLWEAQQERDVVLVGVGLLGFGAGLSGPEGDTEEDMRAFAQEVGVTYPLVADTGAVAQEYGVSGLPTTVFVTPEGRILRRWLGLMDEARLASFIEEAQTQG